MATIRRNFSERSALRVLRAVRKSVDKILEVPPGNMLLERYDPNFRAASQRCSALYRNTGETSVGRLAAWPLDRRGRRHLSSSVQPSAW